SGSGVRRPIPVVQLYHPARPPRTGLAPMTTPAGRRESQYRPFGSDTGNGSPAPSSDGVRLTPQDLFLFNEGSHLRLYEKLGSHPAPQDGQAGYHFAVWAPNADYVSVVGDFNGWDRGKNPLRPTGSSGVWSGFIPGVGQGVCYKYHIAAPGGFTAEKNDP